MNELNTASAEVFVKKILENDKAYLSRAITLLESTQDAQRKKAALILELCLPYSGNSLRVGITGVPGAGKSTFIENLGKLVVLQNKKLAVLAIDPSGKKTKGSILGDKTRMEHLVKQQQVFIRPSSASGTLGGIKNSTRESIILLEAAGYDLIFVETVGVGQSETAVYDITDIFILLLLAGAGDELQGMKKGIMEMADIICINKADHDNVEKAAQTKRILQRALHLFADADNGWNCIVETCSALYSENLDTIWQQILNYEKTVKQNYFFEKKREQQMLAWFRESFQTQLNYLFTNNTVLQQELKLAEQQVAENKILPSAAAARVIEILQQKLN